MLESAFRRRRTPRVAPTYWSIMLPFSGRRGPWEIDPFEFERTMRVDFLVPVALYRVLIPDMISRGAGWIVNISRAGGTGPRPLFSTYGSAKTALVRFGETLAAETTGRGIGVNSIAPGAFSSTMTGRSWLHLKSGPAC